MTLRISNDIWKAEFQKFEGPGWGSIKNCSIFEKNPIFKVQIMAILVFSFIFEGVYVMNR